MSNLYYVTAVGPATYNIGGKVVRLHPGESRGPYSQAELDQIFANTDRSRLRAVAFQGSSNKAPVVDNSGVVDPFTLKEVDKDTNDELYRGVTSETVNTPFVDNANEPLFVPATRGSASIKVEEIVLGPVIPEPEVEIIASSSAQVIAEYINPEDVKKPEVEKLPETKTDSPRRTRKAKSTVTEE